MDTKLATDVEIPNKSPSLSGEAPVPGGNRTKQHKSDRRDWAKVRRATVVITILALTTVAGIGGGNLLLQVIPNWRFSKLGNLKWDVTTVGLFSVLSLVEKLFKLAKVLAEYWSKAGTPVASLFPDCGALLIAVAYISFLLKWLPPPSVATLPAPRRTVYLAKVPSEPVAAFSFLFDMGSSTFPGKSDDPQIVELKKLVSSLESCVGERPNQNVVIQMQGFADANDFSPSNPDKNRDLANDRAKALHSVVEQQLGPQVGRSKLIFDQDIWWNSVDEMKGSRRWLAVKALKIAGATKDEGLFDRRADILLWHAGICQPLETTDGN